MTRLNRRFARHYAKMVAAMFLGMAVLGAPIGWALGAAGSSWHDVGESAPALMLLLMAVAVGTLLAVQHVAMLAGMLARADEYARHAHREVAA